LIYTEFLFSYTEFLYKSFCRKVKRNVDFTGILFNLFQKINSREIFQKNSAIDFVTSLLQFR
jgi:hypothetical protein